MEDEQEKTERENGERKGEKNRKKKGEKIRTKKRRVSEERTRRSRKRKRKENRREKTEWTGSIRAWESTVSIAVEGCERLKVRKTTEEEEEEVRKHDREKEMNLARESLSVLGWDTYLSHTSI